VLEGDNVPENNDQGYFPVGSDCAKKLGPYALRAIS
jgi:hypothetical protein